MIDKNDFTVYIEISIHSLRVEGDNTAQAEPAAPEISIHSLRVEGDNLGKKTHDEIVEFQSTPSAWRETCDSQFPAPFCHISIHSLRVEGDNMLVSKGFLPTISIHSLRVEGDSKTQQPKTLQSLHFAQSEQVSRVLFDAVR